MIKFLNAHITHATVLAAGWLIELACATFHFRLIHDPVVLESF